MPPLISTMATMISPVCCIISLKWRPHPSRDAPEARGAVGGLAALNRRRSRFGILQLYHAPADRLLRFVPKAVRKILVLQYPSYVRSRDRHQGSIGNRAA